MGYSALFLTRFSLFGTHALHRMWLLFQPFSSAKPFTVPCCTLRVPWKAQILFVSSASSADESFEDNMWNPLIELLCYVQIGGIFKHFVDETDLVRIVVCCHFARDLLCDKERAHASV